MNRKRVRNAVFYIIITGGALLSTAPVLYMFSASLMRKQDIFGMPIRLIPPEVRWANYVDIFTLFDLHRYFLNSVFVAACVVVFNLMFSAMAGYSLAKGTYRGRRIVFYFILSTMMVPFTVIVIPLYILVRDLGWLDTYWALIVPAAMTPFGVFLMRQFIVGLPDDYLEAARIDGCSEVRLFFSIVLPLLKPALSALAIITFTGNWDSFLWPLISISIESLKTLPLGLARFVSAYGTEWHLLMSASVVSTLPLLLIFVVLQRRFIEGMSGLSGIK
ncbi:MAG: carbohydrate ABC transporter permease [Firmicutes bacterium]|mgnify:CR=1 FL=1|nr:carbohydrate ABC transporter permease [Bacillota bacterium]